ncbi:Multidrug resistance protein NorM [Vibrio mediterranei]|jgi:MATE family multidrug resistance protein|uniref:Multidrug resistance protein NorM n=1 Tax=Vibrio mediterranei TaxID=689 RepID=A0A2C9PC55_9VIBR|nr:MULTISPECIES: MATE family efflux transporter [Vibrio]ASI90332.1 MATE family efflux transporter [Vibrio mediterranei]AYV22291.1 MATE family efflux transporter [Vibrio mediterranei]MCF4174711.1 MATE family efflux transporter [Vibrio sp. McD22-P3]MCG9656272.1 MATE family efflux transporter [Vibrio mediterranei]MCG9664668.1 MATE family efflux transporter [Vibrio mediterranei]
MQTTTRPFSRFTRESGALMHLSIPIILTQLATQAMGFVDTTMAGQVSAADLAAIALGASLWIPVLLLLRGVIMALTPVVAYHRGARDFESISVEFFQMVWLALISSALLVAYLVSAKPILEWIGVASEIIPIASDYAFALAFGVPGIALFYTLNGFCEGMNNTKAPMIISVIGLLVNIPVNYILIYGKFGFPELGAVGCGWATSLVYWLMSGLLYSYIKGHHHYKTIIRFTDIKPRAKEMIHLLRLGLPIGMNIAVCGSIFAVIALLIGRIGAENVAAAQIALNISSMTYVIPMSISFGITIRVGHALGAKDEIGAIERSKIGILVAGLMSLISVTIFLLFPDWIIRLYTTDPAVSATAATLLVFTAMYQFSDALQTSSNGALRGYKDTKVPMLLAIASYWGLALPLGIVLGLTDHIVPAMGEKGFWIGILTGLTVAAILMLLRLRHVIKKRPPITSDRASDGMTTR